MQCKKCKQEIADEAIYCMYCGKKQTAAPRTRHRKRAHGTGTIRKDSRYKNPYIAIAPSSTSGKGRVYIGAYPDMKTAQAALEDYIKHGRPELHRATLEDIYRIWSDTHYAQIKDNSVSQWKATWKRFEPLYKVKMEDLRTVHFQDIINGTKSKSYADKVKTLACQLCRCAMENDIVDKNYAEFVKMPKFEKSQKVTFTNEQIATLWEHSEDKRVQAILVMIYMGFRITELVSLTTKNIHLEDGYIIGGIKTEAGTDRTIPFPPSIPEIKEFFRQWTSETLGGKLFDMTSNQFRENLFYEVLSELGMINGKRDKNHKWTFSEKHHLTPHSTRHTFASLSAAAGMKAENLQKIIGHANYSTTANIYIHQDMDTLKEEMAKLKK